MHSPDIDAGDETSSHFEDMPPRVIPNSPTDRPDSLRSIRDRAMSVHSGSTTVGARDISFAEALHDIISQELRA